MAVALTSIRALFNGTWYTLTLNPATGDYEAPITAPAAAGRYPVTVEAVNDEGQRAEATASKLIRAELDPPVITFTTPPGWYKDPAQPISFQLRDAGGVDINTLALALDGETVTRASVVAVEGGYNCTYTPTPLEDGTHVLSVTVADVSENEATASLTWHIDATAPTLAIESPTAGLVTNVTTLTISGLAGDAGIGLDKLTINGQTVPIVDGAFSLAVTLAEGYNDYTITVSDQLGNTRTETRRVLLDTTPPVIESVTLEPDITAQPAGEMYRVTVVLAASPLPKAQETVAGHNGGDSITFSGDGLVFTGWTPRAESYVITVTASDAAGNVSAPYVLVVEDPLSCRLTWNRLDYLNYYDLNRIERNTAFLHAAARKYGIPPGAWLHPRGTTAAEVRDIGGGQTLTIPAHDQWIRYDPLWPADTQRIAYNVQALKHSMRVLSGWQREWLDLDPSGRLTWELLYAMEYDLNLFERFLTFYKFHKFYFYCGQLYCGMV